MRILVTGASGYLMSALIPKIKEKWGTTERNLRILGTDIRETDNISVNDLTDSFQVETLFQDFKPNYVIQGAASVYGVGGFNKNNADILSNDITVHANVLRNAVKYGTQRVIFISSSMVYENCMPSKHGNREEEIWNYPAPLTDYGFSKYVNERQSIAFQKQYGLEYTIWRPFNIINPLEISGGDIGNSHVFADLIRNIVGEKLNPVPILGDGNQVRCFTWIGDVVDAISNWSFAGLTKNETYNLGNKEPVTVKDLATVIKELAFSSVENLEFTSVGSYKNDVLYRVPNVDKAMNQLGWTAQKDLVYSVTECLKHYYRTMKW